MRTLRLPWQLAAWGALSGRERRRRLLNVTMFGLTTLAAALTVLPLLLILGHLLRTGLAAVEPSLFVRGPAPPGQSGGGIAHALVGSALMVGTAAVVGIPVAVGVGLFLHENRRRAAADAVRFLADVMNGLPSIVVGLFVWATVVLRMGHFSGLAGALALALILLPLVLRTTEEMLRLVPRELYEGALALGAPGWRATLAVVLPAARSGILTGALVGLARVAGETAPLLFTALGSHFLTWRLDRPMSAVPLQIFVYATGPYPEWHRQAWAAALVLLGFVLLVNVAARFLIRPPDR